MDNWFQPLSNVKPPKTEQQIKQELQPQKSVADGWKKTEVDNIEYRYRKINDTILSWGKEKMEKAGGRECEMIRKIAGAAIAEVGEKKRKEEQKMERKLDIIRKTGQLPKTCFCF